MYPILSYMMRLLICIELVESKKPFGKLQQEIWRLECDLGVITDIDCPMDGGWSAWTSWSNCQGTCDYLGHRRRYRECNNPPTSKDGTPCTGPNEQVETCYITNCSVEDFRKLIEGDIPRLEAMKQLEVVPALLERCLQMDCPYEAIEAALSSDNTWHLNPEALWNSLLCVKHNLGCPIRGEWGVWGSWSACGARCGKGLRWRLRRCDTPPPSDASLTCPGVPLDFDECSGEQCALEGRFTDTTGVWSEWGEWSSCSEYCGSGVRRRKRTCLERYIPSRSFTWGTHCRGQFDELEICINNECALDGGWSGWGPWGPCSQACGAGRRSRSRSCTKPIPSEEGKHCEGPLTETGSCYLEPCELYNHLVALFNGDSYLQYNFSKMKFTLFHFYVRFMPRSPSGTLVRRGPLQRPSVRLSLQKWHVCLDATGISQACGLARVCSATALEPAIWHTALITVSSETATIRLDNALIPIVGAFPCDPEFDNSAINVFIGERYNGEIQDIKFNFKQLELTTETDTRKHPSYFPAFTSNVAYEKANMAEAFLYLENDHYIRIPCFKEQDEWQLELTLKPKRKNGLILFFYNDIKYSFFYMTLQNMRVKIKFAIDEFKYESISSTDFSLDQWLEIKLSKKKGINMIELTINSGERLHLRTEYDIKSRREAVKINQRRKHKKKISNSFSMCNDEFFLGNIPIDVRNEISKEFTPFNGVLASLRINGALVDLQNCTLERFKDNIIQLSSRTASISRTYHETAWAISNSMNLTCLYSRNAATNKFAHWFFLDTSLSKDSDDDVRVVDDGKITKLVVRKETDPKGFYTCRAHSNRNTYNVITYGIVGHIDYNLNSPDLTTIIAVFTTVTLIVCTLSWLISEGINDLRMGYGFFRDAHFSPQEEAEAVCRYIDQNVHCYTSVGAMKSAKARARRKARELASKMSFGAQEPQGLIQMRAEIPAMINESESSDLETLPALPEISSQLHTSSDVYRCEPWYGSPPSGAIQSSEQSSSYGMSPRTLCSRLLLTKYKSTSKESVIFSRKNKSKRHADATFGSKTKLITIKSSSLLNLSPAQKVLQKFRDLKRDDF